MKKLLSIALAIMMMLCLSACADRDEKDEDIVLPPVRESENPIYAEYRILDENFAALVERADLVVRLNVKNWLGEDSFYEETCYEVEILEIYKGQIDTEIVLLQAGTSEATMRGYPLFTYGNELFLCLLNYDEEIEKWRALYPEITYPELSFDNAYSIAGGPLAVWFVETLEDGESYMVPFFGRSKLSDEIIEVGGYKNYGSGASDVISAEGGAVAQALISNDEVMNPGESPKAVLKLNDIVTYLFGSDNSVVE